MLYAGLALCALCITQLFSLGWELTRVRSLTMPAARKLNRIGYKMLFLVITLLVGLVLLAVYYQGTLY
jgi:hypothetical protein